MRSVFDESVLRGLRRQIAADLSATELARTIGPIVIVVGDEDTEPSHAPTGDNPDDSPDPNDKTSQPDSGKLSEPAAVDELPAKVRMFWDHQEAAVPPWRLESAAEREQRHEAQRRGCWTG